MSYFVAWAAAVAILAVLNGLVSLKVVRAEGLTKPQRTLQLTLVWLVPAFGPILVYLVHTSYEERQGPPKPPFGGEGHDGMPGGVQ